MQSVLKKMDALDNVEPVPSVQDRRDRIQRTLNRFEKAKLNTQGLTEYMNHLAKRQDELIPEYMPAFRERIRKLTDCGSWLRVKDYFQSGSHKFETSRCRQHLLCQTDAILRGARTMGNIIKRLQQKELFRYYPYLLTLTVKNEGSLSSVYQKLMDSWSKMLNHRTVRCGYGGNAMSHFVGGFSSVEIKRGSTHNLWHPHMHCLCLAGHSISDGVNQQVFMDDRGKYRFPTLSAEWLHLTGDSNIVECHPIVDEVGRQLNPLEVITSENQFRDSYIKAICEVSKYAVKIGDLKVEDAFEAWKVLRGKRNLRTFGIVRGSIEDEAEPTESEIEPFIESLYSWSGKFYNLKKVRMVKHEQADRE